MNPPGPLRRHPYLVLAGLLLTGTALWIGYFLATFDLDRYRDHIAQELSHRLQTPVRLGEARLELREGGVAFRFTELQAGNTQTRTELQARQLWLQLAWHGLLLGRPILTEIALDAPRLRISPAPSVPPEEASQREPFSLKALSDLRVRRVEIHQGTVDFGWRYGSGAEHAVSLGDIAVEIADFGLSRTVAFDATGNLHGPNEPARVAINGSVELPATGRLHEATWDLAMTVKTLDATQLARLLPEDIGAHAEGTADLDLFVKGSIAEAVTFQSEVTGRQLRITPGSAHGQTLPLRHLQIAGLWQPEGQTHRLRKLALQVDDLRLAGEVTVQPAADGRQIDTVLNNCTLPVDALRRWLPADLAKSQPLLAKLRPGGLLSLRHATFQVLLPVTAGEHGSWSFDRLDGEAKDLAWTIGPDKTAELATLTLLLEQGRWQFQDGSGTIAGLPVTFAGTATPRAGTPAQLDLELNGSGTAAQLAAFWPKPLPPELALTGNLTLQGRLSGTTELMTVDARLDLAPLDLRFGEQLHLPPTPGASFTLYGQATRTDLTIDRADLVLPPANGRLSGKIDWSNSPAVDLAARLELPDLTAVHEVAPQLGKLQLRGGAAIDLTASGAADAVRVRSTLELRDIAIPTHGVVADISQLNGRLLQDGKGIRSEKLTARLGKSPVILQARVADLDAPRLELGVKASAIRADELIFHSDRAVLHDVSGQLLLDRDGIAFMPVQVRLAGGTRATVRGSVKDFANPRVDLDIVGEFAKVDEIIRLWTDKSPAAEAARQARPHKDTGHFPAIRIQATARQGDLYGMKFSNATALIVPTRGQLLLHPLDFKVGEGYCTSQVLVNFSGDKTLLRVSGHAENVDAYAVYNELLDRKSIMRGSLRGDFYLQGELGKPGFLPTSFGNFNVTISNGVMRHSPVLATIFSILNVSQLLTLQLPDVSSEGVPFTLLTAEARVDKGILRSEDLVIDSNAMSMSYVGQYDMVGDDLDLLIVVKPLGTIDKLVSNLPIAGWILGGEERALITAQFKVTGPARKPEVEAIPISAMSKGVLGIFQRTLSLPLKLIEDPAILWGGGGEKKD